MSNPPHLYVWYLGDRFAVITSETRFGMTVTPLVEADLDKAMAWLPKVDTIARLESSVAELRRFNFGEVVQRLEAPKP